VSKNHSETQSGSRHSPINAEYPTPEDVEAGTNEINGLRQSDLVEQQWSKSVYGLWVLNDLATNTSMRVINADSESSIEGERFCHEYDGPFSKRCDGVNQLFSNGSITMPPQSFGFGRFMLTSHTGTPAAEWIVLAWDSTGTPTEIGKSANAILSDTAGNMCAFSSGSNYLVIRNRLGSTLYLLFEAFYKEL